MKRLILSMAMVLSSLFAMSQMNQITWLNGRAVLGQPIEQIDSIKYGTMEDADQLVLWLPRTIMVHDTVIVYDTVIISTCDSIHIPEGLEMVDLGLPSGLKWANMNVGASSPEDYGDYFAWGETMPKEVYNWSTYKWCKGSYDTLTKYCTSSSYGTVDNKTTLELADDAAHVNWGGNWRMPTYAEFNELKDNCTWTRKENYNNTGVNGYIVSSKINSNFIFLPASGYRIESSLSHVGSIGYYRSSSLGESYSTNAYYLTLGQSVVAWLCHPRCNGCSIRPVCK